jgi:hypothetical protein
MRGSKAKTILRCVYRAAPGARYNHKEAQIIGETFESMTATGQSVTPDSVVAFATLEDSPLHSYFTWDDTEAAKRWRKHEARQLLNHLLVIVETPSGSRIERAAYSVRIVTEEEVTRPQRHYISIGMLKGSEELQEQMREEAWSELRSFTQKYDALGFEEFAPVYAFAESRMK